MTDHIRLYAIRDKESGRVSIPYPGSEGVGSYESALRMWKPNRGLYDIVGVFIPYDAFMRVEDNNGSPMFVHP